MKELDHYIFHTEEIKNKSFLVTGGAGFIGSSIVDYLIRNGAYKVRVLDNMSNGFMVNIESYLNMPCFEFIVGDITDPEVCRLACKDINMVSHQAALGSVPRSIAFPLHTHGANSTGFLNMLVAARDSGVERFVYASSSSVYGDIADSPKRESAIGNALSPYAVSKYTNELYAAVFAKNYNMKLIGLRYFNVFGPKQDPNGPYAAVIPLFMDALINNTEPWINGDGEQTRDFTFVFNAVQANIKSFFTTNEDAVNKVYNVAVGKSSSVNEIYNLLAQIAGKTVKPKYRDERPGDVRHSLADITLARTLLGYEPIVNLKEGLESTFAWFKQTY